ncbi:MAG TPA: alpha/beta fold hydrolase [Gaiellaceae bacterium]|jgi:pimeloyl-ACP methyl ester carboxylesterase/quercetin dioxygenase-like cupin family protein|nr:alpha/beta fold hydrolase [Gaiellaceae bacterium]
MIEKRLEVDDAELRVEIEGEGVPLVLVHGLGLSGALWRRVSEALGAGHRLVRVDLRGSPRSRESVRRELSLERWAADLGAVVDLLELERPVLVGHSLGAAISLKLALERPRDVRALVLIGTEANLSNLAPRMRASAERIESGTLEAWVAGPWSEHPPFSVESLRRDPSILAEYRSLLLENDAGDYVRQCRAIASAEDLSGRLGDVTVPTLVVIGGSDDRTLPERGRELAAAIPRGRFVELSGTGHTIPLEAPEATAAAITGFVAELDGDPARPAGDGAEVLRAETTPRNPAEGPFGHLDVRWVVGAHTGASLIAFGQSTYPRGATHETHYHPNAEEVVMVLKGRGTQVVGDRTLDLGPGDICFIPRSTPHRITGASAEPELVILWAFGGAASMEQAGYVPLPDEEEEPT